jgi:hypothetical protein
MKLKSNLILVLITLFLVAALVPSTAVLAYGGSEPSTFETLSGLLQPVLVIVLPVLAAVVVAWAIRMCQTKKADLSERQYLLLRWLVSAGVWAAEQAFEAGQIPKESRERKVLEFVQSMANKYKIPVDVPEIYFLIRAAVGEELNKAKLVKPTVPKLPE